MLEQIIDIVRRAGDIVLSAHDIQNVTREKHGPADLVTQYDEAVQVFLRQELLKLLPEAEFFGEEGERPALTHPWIFVVDPIDGTTNFTRRMNCSSVSVALVHNGQTEYGVVYNPFVGELFAAQRGCGATLNGAPIRASSRDAAHAIVACGSTIYDLSGPGLLHGGLRPGGDLLRVPTVSLGLCRRVFDRPGGRRCRRPAGRLLPGPPAPGLGIHHQRRLSGNAAGPAGIRKKSQRALAL